MHILLIPSFYPSKKDPFPGVFFRDQALALHHAGHQVVVLVTPRIKPKRDLLSTRDTSIFQSEIETYDDSGILTYQAESWCWYPRILQVARIGVISRTFFKMFSEYQKSCGIPDLIHAHNSLYGGYLGALVRERIRVPFVLTEHFSGFERGLIKTYQMPYVRKAFQTADIRLAVSHALIQSINQFEPTHAFSIIENLVDTDFFTPPINIKSPPPFNFCAICALNKNKGLDILIRAFAKAFHSQDVFLTIAGEGDQRNFLNELIYQLGLQHQVHLLGYLSKEGVKHLIQTSHAVVSASWIETFGVNLIEAMACGKPVVATRSGGPEDFINPQNGLLAPVGNINMLASCLMQMVENWTDFDSEYIRAYCIDKFSERAIVAKLEKTYIKLVGTYRVN